MSANFEKFTEVKAPVSPAAKLYETGAAGREKLVVSQSVEPENMRRLLESLAREDCAHSWKNFGPEGTLDGLLQWENEHRPTEIFFFYLGSGSERQMIGAGAVAGKLNRDFPHPGFCVIGRCYIMPQFRERGFYRRILRHRLEYCRAQFGNALNGIHIGSVNERISRVITKHGLAGWPDFIHLGEEALSVAGQIKTVGAYMLLMPEYLRKIENALAGDSAPACVAELRNVLSRIGSGNIRDLGRLVKEPFEEARAGDWFDERDSREIEQLLLFCESIPLAGFK
jgi:GNAT superfamily N-acetyltransferase